MFKCSNVQMFKCSNIQMFKCSNFQKLKYSSGHFFKGDHHYCRVLMKHRFRKFSKCYAKMEEYPKAKKKQNATNRSRNKGKQTKTDRISQDHPRVLSPYK